MYKKKEKLLYIMGIDWDWIYQRPQIIAQHLEELYDVTVVFPRSITKLMNKGGGNYPSSYKILWTLPFQEKNKLIGWITNIFHKRIFLNANQYSVIYIGYPLYYRYISNEYTGKIIYDCMDNYEALYPDKKRVAKVLNQEKRLVEQSHCLLVTGQKLKEKMDALAQIKKSIIIRNGTQLGIYADIKEPEKKETYKIGYFGTIAEWFDYNLLTMSLKQISNIEYHLIGPVVQQYKIKHNRMIFEGIVEHKSLRHFIADYDCLIMPFIVNDIVELVDPVKLYEYIAMGKCIVSIYYEEIKRFEGFVYFYQENEEFLAIIKTLIENGFPPKYSKEEQVQFLNENSWETRFNNIDMAMKSI